MNSRAAEVVTALLLFVLGSTAAADTPYEVTPLPPLSSSGHSYTSHFTAVGDAIYFYADTPGGPRAIWKWTEADGAKQVKSLVAHTYYYTPPPPVHLMALGDKLLFATNVDPRGSELWITDGTSDGASIVKDIYDGGSSTPVPLVVAAGKAYFTAFDPDHGRELWVTDGTEAGTTLIDLTGDSDGSYPINAIASGGLAYFSALGRLWVSDGTVAGTRSLASGVSGTRAGVLNGRTSAATTIMEESSGRQTERLRGPRWSGTSTRARFPVGDRFRLHSRRRTADSSLLPKTQRAAASSGSPTAPRPGRKWSRTSLPVLRRPSSTC